MEGVGQGTKRGGCTSSLGRARAPQNARVSLVGVEEEDEEAGPGSGADKSSTSASMGGSIE